MSYQSYEPYDVDTYVAAYDASLATQAKENPWSRDYRGASAAAHAAGVLADSKKRAMDEGCKQ